MVKQIKFRTQPNFFRNDSEECGAQALALKTRGKNDIVVKTWTQKIGQLWGFVSPDKLILLCEKNNGMYEIISDFPHKVYFDIDKKVDKLYTDDEQQEHMNKMISIINNIFPDAKCAVSGSYTDEKVSYHIILQNYMIYNLEDRETMKVIIDYIKKEYDPSFDNAVYSKNRPMKCINQSKPKENRIQGILYDENWKNHFITCYFENHTLPFPEFENEIQEAIYIAKAKAPYNVSTLPKYNLKVPKNINWLELEPLDILALLPLDDSFDGLYRHRIARFCFYNGISFDIYLNWLKKAFPNLEKNREGQKKWNIISTYPSVSISQMKPILAYYYPDIKKDIHFRNFTNLFNIDETIEKIKIDRLAQEHYNFNKKLTCIHLGMGCGKTAQTIDFLKNKLNNKHKNETECLSEMENFKRFMILPFFREQDEDEDETKISSFMWVGHRQSLHQGTYKRICDAEIDCFDYSKGTSSTKNTLYNEEPSIAICVNSLNYIDENKTYDVIIIDEIESVLESFMGDFMDNKNSILKKLCNLIRTAKKIIVLDAFITNKTIEFFRSIDKDITIDILTKDVVMTNNIYFKNVKNDEKGSKNNDDDDNDYKMNAITEIITELKKDKKIFMFYPYKKDMAELAETIQVASGKKCIYYNADRGDKIKQTLCNVNETWSEYDCVITNTCITCGVNFDLNGYDSCWLFLAGFIKPRDAIQASARIRYLDSKNINVVFLGKKLINPSVYIDDRTSINNEVYNTIYKNSLIEDKAPRRKAFETFCHKSGYKMDKSKLLVNKELVKEVKEIFEDTNCRIDFMDIPNIDEDESERLKQTIMSHQASLFDKITLRKYYIMNKFNSSILEEEVGVLYENNQMVLFDKLNQYLNDVEEHRKFINIFQQIQDINNWKFIIPSNNEINKQTKHKFEVKLNDTIIEQIFTHFNFRDIHKHSKPIQIIKNIYNIAFGCPIINTNYDGQHTTAYITPSVIETMPLICYLINKGTYTTLKEPIKLDEGDWTLNIETNGEMIYFNKSMDKIMPNIETYFNK